MEVQQVILVMFSVCVIVMGEDHEPSDRFAYPSDFSVDIGPRSPYHRPDYIPPLVRESDKEETSPRRPAFEDPMKDNSPPKIPLDFIRNLNDFSVNDLLLNFVEGDIDAEVVGGGPSLSSRFGGGEGEERSVANIPKAAGCIPETKTIKLKTSDDPSVLYIPQCTRVQQCGGCCSHSLLSCQPNQTELLTFQVLKTQYNGNKKLKLVGKEPVVVEKHLSCKCDCKVKEESCNKYQEYRKSECRCACTNSDEEHKCYKSYAKKLWNPELCACQCREVFQCSSGYSFDSRDCKCIPTPVRRRYSAEEDFPLVDFS